MNEITALIAELAHAVSEWEGGTVEGTVYTYASWREKLRDIAERAHKLSSPAVCEERFTDERGNSRKR